MAVTAATWSPSSWRSRRAHQPQWPRRRPPRPPASGSRRCRRSCSPARRARSERARRGRRGPGVPAPGGRLRRVVPRLHPPIAIRERLKILLQMSAVLTYGAALPVVKVGRIAGQFAKPRSSPTERVGGRRAAVLPRAHGPRRRADRRGARARPGADGAGLPPVGRDAQPAARVHEGRLRRPDAGAHVEPGVRRELAGGPAVRGDRVRDRARARASWPRAGSTSRASRSCTRSTSGRATRASLLDYEEALTRRDSLTGDWYDCSAHMLWIGERTRQLDGAHVEFFAGVHNPLGVKLGPDGDAGRGGRALRAAQPAARPRPADADRADGRRARVESCCRRSSARCARPGTRSSGPATRCTRTSSGRRRAQDAPLRRDHGRDRGLLRRLPRRRAPGRAASTSSSPART